jgi:hypothetical protein
LLYFLRVWFFYKKKYKGQSSEQDFFLRKIISSNFFSLLSNKLARLSIRLQIGARTIQRQKTIPRNVASPINHSS